MFSICYSTGDSGFMGQLFGRIPDNLNLDYTVFGLSKYSLRKNMTLIIAKKYFVYLHFVAT